MLEKGMKQKYHLISSVVSMTLTGVLLVCVCLAWYVTNKEATASGVIGNVVDKEDLVDKIEFYEITGKNAAGTVFTVGENITNADNTVEMGAYNPLFGATPQRLMVITLKSEKNVLIEAQTKASYYLGSKKSDSSNDLLQPLEKTGNSLTSVIGFYYLTDITLSSNIPTQIKIADTSDKKVFADINANEITSKITIGSTAEATNRVYILLDYYEESIEHIYSLNIGNDNLNPSGDSSEEHADDIQYSCDFYFLLKEVISS